MAQIERLCANPVPMNSAEQIQNIIMFLQRSSDLSKHVDSLLQILALLQSKDHTQFVLNPVLPDELRDATSLRCQSYISYDLNSNSLAVDSIFQFLNCFSF